MAATTKEIPLGIPRFSCETFLWRSNVIDRFRNTSIDVKITHLARQLKSEADNFRKVLDTQPLFENWVEQVLAKGLSMPGRVSPLTDNNAGVVRF